MSDKKGMIRVWPLVPLTREPVSFTLRNSAACWISGAASCVFAVERFRHLKQQRALEITRAAHLGRPAADCFVPATSTTAKRVAEKHDPSDVQSNSQSQSE